MIREPQLSFRFIDFRVAKAGFDLEVNCDVSEEKPDEARERAIPFWAVFAAPDFQFGSDRGCGAEFCTGGRGRPNSKRAPDDHFAGCATASAAERSTVPVGDY